MILLIVGLHLCLMWPGAQSTKNIKPQKKPILTLLNTKIGSIESYGSDLLFNAFSGTNTFRQITYGTSIIKNLGNWNFF
jgi:hypothetical protein